MFCCYVQLSRFVPYSKFFTSICYLFPSSREQEQCLEKVTYFQPLASNLHNLFSTLLSCSQELGKQVTHTWKNYFQFTTPDFTVCKQGLDFTNKIPISISLCDVRRTWNRFSAPTYICRHYCVLRFYRVHISQKLIQKYEVKYISPNFLISCVHMTIEYVQTTKNIQFLRTDLTEQAIQTLSAHLDGHMYHVSQRNFPQVRASLS